MTDTAIYKLFWDVARPEQDLIVLDNPRGTNNADTSDLVTWLSFDCVGRGADFGSEQCCTDPSSEHDMTSLLHNRDRPDIGKLYEVLRSTHGNDAKLEKGVETGIVNK